MTITAEASDLKQDQPTKPLGDAVQRVLCQVFHSTAITCTELHNAFANNADQFNKDNRNDLQEILTKLNDETSVCGLAYAAFYDRPEIIGF